MAIAEESLMSISEVNIIKTQKKGMEVEEDHYYTYNAGPVPNPAYSSPEPYNIRE